MTKGGSNLFLEDMDNTLYLKNPNFQVFFPMIWGW